jgi:hypothetical protein
MNPKNEKIADFDPDASPFEMPPVEGIPYKKGSDEDIAVRRVIAEAEEAERRRREKEARELNRGA